MKYTYDLNEEKVRQVAEQLEIDPDIHFVTVESDGSIGFTAGKPEEIRMLRNRVLKAGLKPSARLTEAADNGI